MHRHHHLRIPSVHLHFAICIGDDEDVDIGQLFRGWRGRILTWLGFTVDARWVLLHREPVGAAHELHIVPVGDGMAHDIHRDECVCGPFARCETHDFLPDSWVYTHSSLDVREIAPTVEDLT